MDQVGESILQSALVEEQQLDAQLASMEAGKFEELWRGS